MKGYMYILECYDGTYYTGSTKNLELRLKQHQNGEGANHTKKRLPVKLVYFEEFQRIDEAFYREKQVQGWSRKKKEALINGDFESLSHLSVAYRDKKPSDNVMPEEVAELSRSALEGRAVGASSASTPKERPLSEVPGSSLLEALETKPLSEVLEDNDTMALESNNFSILDSDNIDSDNFDSDDIDSDNFDSDDFDSAQALKKEEPLSEVKNGASSASAPKESTLSEVPGSSLLEALETKPLSEALEDNNTNPSTPF